MQFGAVLEIAIGLIFIWLVLSIGVMQIQEWLENILAWRSKFLEQAVRGMLEDKHMGDDFFNHPAIKALYRKTGVNKMPARIPPERFSKVILDVFVNSGKPPDELPAGSWSISKMQANLKAMQKSSPALAQKLGYIFTGIDDKAAKLDEKLSEWHRGFENWYNDTMSQVSAEYKKFAQLMAFLIGLAISVSLNVDSIQIARELWQEPTVRAVIVAQAQARVEAGGPATDFQESINSLVLPIGWQRETIPQNAWEWFIKSLGFLLSGAAAAQGAPFWFDALRKLVDFKTQPAQESKKD
jgi:hypothetical protein